MNKNEKKSVTGKTILQQNGELGDKEGNNRSKGVTVHFTRRCLLPIYQGILNIS